MNHIEEMMEIAEVKYEMTSKKGLSGWRIKNRRKYPPFTPEKQLEIIKLITSSSIKNDNSDNNSASYIKALNPNLYKKDRWAIGTDWILEQDETFENALAKAVIVLIKENELDKQEVKRILENDR